MKDTRRVDHETITNIPPSITLSGYAELSLSVFIIYPLHLSSVSSVYG
ncbi:MAG: hypothetical protein QXT54_01880 [Thermoplasmatales archaeon]